MNPGASKFCEIYVVCPSSISIRFMSRVISRSRPICNGIATRKLITSEMGWLTCTPKSPM